MFSQIFFASLALAAPLAQPANIAVSGGTTTVNGVVVSPGTNSGGVTVESGDGKASGPVPAATVPKLDLGSTNPSPASDPTAQKSKITVSGGKTTVNGVVVPPGTKSGGVTVESPSGPVTNSGGAVVVSGEGNGSSNPSSTVECMTCKQLPPNGKKVSPLGQQMPPIPSSFPKFPKNFFPSGYSPTMSSEAAPGQSGIAIPGLDGETAEDKSIGWSA